MGFVRLKKIKGQEYAYFVNNFWTANGCRQKVGKYLGKLIICQRTSNDNLMLTKETYFERIIDLIKQELIRHGFQITENKFKLNNIELSLEHNQVTIKNKKVVLKLNEGFLCEHTLVQLKEFNPKTEKDLETLASLLVEAGIKLEENLFLQLCEPIIAKVKDQPATQEDFYY